MEFALPDLTPMHTLVGHGITLFSNVELAVGFCFASMMEPADRKCSIVVFNSARSFEAKLKMIDALAEAALAENQLQTWRGLSSKVRRRKVFRDKLAHWSVGYYPGASNIAEAKKMKPGLLPPVWSADHMQAVWNPNGNHTHKAISQKELETFIVKVNALANQLMKLSIELSSDTVP
jgi:hypothetical protein